MKPVAFAGVLLVCVASVCSVSGCRSGMLSKIGNSFGNITKLDNGKVFAVTTEKTAFYKYGPQQGNGPDRSLERDALMTLIRPSFGYCKVQLKDSGEQGYVASEDIKPASPALLAKLNTPPAPVLAAAPAPEPQRLDLESADTSYVPPPEGLPAPDLPPPSVSPAPQ